MIVTYLRSSSISTFDSCEQRYFIDYILGWYGSNNKASVKGTIAHKVLEILALVKLAQQNGEKKIYDQEVIKERLIKDINDINALTNEVYDFYVTNNTHLTFENSDKTDCRRWVNKTITMNNRGFDPRNREIVCSEREFDITLDFDWAKYEFENNGQKIVSNLAIKGTIDLICKVDETTYEIVDYKTGRFWNWTTNKPKTYKDLQKDPQLKLYHYVCSKLYPGIDTMVTINYMNSGGPHTIAFDHNSIKNTENMLKDKFEKIKMVKIPHLNKGDQCKWCSHGKTTFEDTNIVSQIEDREGQVTPMGCNRTKCEQTKFMIEQKGIDWVINNYTKQGHAVSAYKAPGSI